MRKPPITGAVCRGQAVRLAPGGVAEIGSIAIGTGVNGITDGG